MGQLDREIVWLVCATKFNKWYLYAVLIRAWCILVTSSRAPGMRFNLRKHDSCGANIIESNCQYIPRIEFDVEGELSKFLKQGAT